jgi:hypothetical protein
MDQLPQGNTPQEVPEPMERGKGVTVVPRANAVHVPAVIRLLYYFDEQLESN